jgi:hypothetical protein
MGKKAVMDRFKAKLSNIRWAWDGVTDDGAVVFICWDDEAVRSADGEFEFCRILKGGHAANARPGGRERIRHIQQVLEQHCAAYLVIATAKDAHAVPKQISSIDESLYSVRLERRGADIYAVCVGLNSLSPPTHDEQEDSLAAQILSSEGISDTDKQQIIKARVGQGLFRRRLELIEPSCRVTGVRDRAHLRASHIKPWRDSTNEERLDGNNGLLLAPHVDHLFDLGFIGFADSGELLTSPRLDESVIDAWHIDLTGKRNPFNPNQCRYLAYHRAIFGFEVP